MDLQTSPPSCQQRKVVIPGKSDMSTESLPHTLGRQPSGPRLDVESASLEFPAQHHSTEMTET